jgi:hypothetical protein
MNRLELLLTAPIVALATFAHAGSLEEAKQLLDQAAPSHCELFMMQYESRAAAPESGTSRDMPARRYERAMEIESDLAPSMERFEAAKATLTDEQRSDLRNYSSSLLNACAQKAYEKYGVRIPIQVSPEAPRPKAVPYTPPPREKSLQPEVRGGAIQGQQPIGQ